MKIILSRKGFDSANGGYPSPILPDGRLISLPIPSKDKITYNNLKLDENTTYFYLMKQLNDKIKYNKKWHILDEKTECHLDPDVYMNIIKRKSGWTPSFGQINASQTHLENNKVKEGDIFLFFGWFKHTKYKNNKLVFDNTKPDLHIIFSYLEIGKIIKTYKDNIQNWLDYHPHINKLRMNNKTNTVYVSNKKLSYNNALPGSGVFKFNKNLVLTKEGYSRSKWELPNFLKNLNITHHSAKSWKEEGYFKSADIGQEFVIEENKEVENWAKNIIKYELI